MKEKSIYINIMLNVIRVFLSVIFPLITFPYASRILLAENLGKVNYALSVENYFALIAALGISTYGVREGARIRNNEKEFKHFANEIFTVNVITTLIAYLLLTLILVITPKLHDYIPLILLQSVSIIMTTLGMDWINSVFEDYLYITIRSFLIQLALLVIMFLTVRTPDDYYRYAFLSVLSNSLICFLNYLHIRKFCKVRLIKKCNFIQHTKKLLIFFTNNLATNVYLNADTTMLGFFTNDQTVGIYSVSVKVYNVVKAIIAAMFVPCIPRLSAYYGNGDMVGYKKLLNSIINTCTLFMFPAVALMIIMAKPIVLILSGQEYINAYSSLSLISIGIIGAIYGGIITNCINVPMKREKHNLFSTLIAAAVNVILNMFFIPQLRENGAAITTVIAEFTVLLCCALTYKGLRKLVDYKTLFRNIVTALAECIGMAMISKLLSIFISNLFVEMFFLITLSVLLYFFILLVSRNPLLIKNIRN